MKSTEDTMRHHRPIATAVTLAALLLSMASCTADSASTAAPTDEPSPTDKPSESSKPQAYGQTNSSNCVVTGNGVQVAVSHGAGNGSGNESHGTRVHTVVDQELGDQGYSVTTDPAASADSAIIIIDDFGSDGGSGGPVAELGGSAAAIVGVQRYAGNGQTLRVIDMDITSYDPESIARHLAELATHLQVTRPVVLNLSFVYLPCQYLVGASFPEPAASNVESAYVQALSGSSNWTQLNQLQNQLSQAAMQTNLQTRLPLDKNIGAFLESHPTWIPVAAAGNGVGQYCPSGVNFMRLDFPMAPAIWPKVVSVSAAEEADPTVCGTATGTPTSMAATPGSPADRAPYSNSGEARLSGLYQTPSGQLSGEGTSFAAPRLSVRMALYVLNANTTSCSGSSGSSSPPLDHKQWDNLKVDAASDQYCAGF